jgi:hypothetical protein
MLYAVGGYDGSSELSSVERYDVSANTWTAVAPMGSKRSEVGVASVASAHGPLTLRELQAAGFSAAQLRAD